MLQISLRQLQDQRAGSRRSTPRTCRVPEVRPQRAARHRASGSSGAAVSTTGDLAATGATHEALAAFWVEQGLPWPAASDLAAQLHASHGAGTLPTNPSLLTQRLQRLNRVLPPLLVHGYPCAATRLVSREPRVLDQPVEAVMRQVLALADLLPRDPWCPGDAVLRVLLEAPTLLLVDDIKARWERLCVQLLHLYPGRDRLEIESMIARQPELLLLNL